MVKLAAEITHLLQNWQKGDPTALDDVITDVYADLKKLAAYQLSKEAQAHTLHPTALVHEAYLRLVANRHLTFPDRKCFFLFVTMLMRRILVEYARGKMAKKRGGEQKKVFLEIENYLPTQRWDPSQILLIDELLGELKQLDTRKHDLIEMSLFAGLTAHEMGEIFF